MLLFLRATWTICQQKFQLQDFQENYRMYFCYIKIVIVINKM